MTTGTTPAPNVPKLAHLSRKVSLMPNLNNLLKGLDIQAIGGAIAAVIAIIGLITGVSVGATGSSNDTGSSSVVSSPEQRVRDAVIKSIERQGYTVDPTLNDLAQQYVKAETEQERSAAYSKLHAAGMTGGSGGSFVSNEEELVKYFSRSTETLPKNGRKVGVGVDFGAVTTEIQVVYAE